MRFTCITLLFALCVSGTAAQEPKDTLPPAPAGKAWKLVWHDEFDGEKLDETKWQIPPDGKRQSGWWMRKAISLDGKGHLVISTLKDGEKYVDGRNQPPNPCRNSLIQHRLRSYTAQSTHEFC